MSEELKTSLTFFLRLERPHSDFLSPIAASTPAQSYRVSSHLVQLVQVHVETLEVKQISPEMIHLSSFASAHFTSSLRSLFQLFLLFGCLDLPFTSPSSPSALSCPSAKAVTPLHLHFSFSPPDRRTKEREEGRKRPRRLSHQERQNPPYAPFLPPQAYYYCSTPPPRTNGPSCTLATRGKRKSQRGERKKPSQKSMKYLRLRMK